MILGTWGAAFFAYHGGPWAGVLGAALLGLIGGLLHAVATVTFGVDHIVSGVAINLIGAGAATYLAEAIFPDYEGGGPRQLVGLDAPTNITIPGISDAAGNLADHHWFFVSDVASVVEALTTNISSLSLVVFGLVVVSALVLWRTSFGLRLRSCGENPQAAETLGVNVYLYKYIAVLVSGALAGIGGGFLALVSSSGYSASQTGGRGYIGLAAMIFGNWRPGGLLAGALTFGYTDSLRLRDTDARPRPAAARRAGPAADRCPAAGPRADQRRDRDGCRRRRRAGLVPADRLGPARVHGHDAVRHDAVRPGARRPTAANARGRRPAVSKGQRGLAMALGISGPDDPIDWESLAKYATEVMGRAYAPYSEFKVGVAGLVDDGRVVLGCNVENAAYGVGLCAECGMVSALHATGGGRLIAVACVDAKGAPLMPCGRCRQLLWENGGPDMQLMTPSGVKTMTEVLPDAFGADDLDQR